MSLTIPIVKFSPHKELPELEKFLLRPAFDPKAEETARRVLADIRATGDRAVQKYTKEFNGLQLPVAKFAVPREEVLAASAEVDLVFKRSAAEIFTRIVGLARPACARIGAWPRPRAACSASGSRRWRASAPISPAAPRRWSPPR
ncbi:MAG TPA: histidinol dehydrogenase [Kiritimatiellia bacterium]|nr:histidinol dehydrogenase [Kiritimatiellia bacterium]